MTKREKGFLVGVAILFGVPCLVFLVINWQLTAFGFRSWSPRLVAAGWSKSSQPIFLESVPQGVTIGVRGGFAPSSYAMRLLGPTRKAKKLNVKALGRIDSVEIIDEDNLFVLVEQTVEGPQKPGYSNLYDVRRAYRFNVLTEEAALLFGAGEPGDEGNAIVSASVSRDFALGAVARRTGVDIIDVAKKERRNYVPYCKALFVRLSPDKKRFVAYVCIEEVDSGQFNEDYRFRLSRLRRDVKNGISKECYYGLIQVDIKTGDVVDVRPAEPFGNPCVDDSWFESSYNRGTGRQPQKSIVLYKSTTSELVIEKVENLPERCLFCSYSSNDKYLGFFREPGGDDLIKWRDSTGSSVVGSFKLESLAY